MDPIEPGGTAGPERARFDSGLRFLWHDPAEDLTLPAASDSGDAYLRDGRYCSVHGIDLVPFDRTTRTRRYCPRCPPGSALGFPEWMVAE